MATTQTYGATTASVPAPLISDLPDPDAKDQALTNWYDANAGKWFYDRNGQLQQVPTTPGNPNAGTIRGMLSSGILQGASTQAPGISQGDLNNLFLQNIMTGGGYGTPSGMSAGYGSPGMPSYSPQAGGMYSYGQPGWMTPVSGTGAGGATGGGGNSMATTTATQIPQGISLPSWQTWYGQNQGKTVLINGQPQTIGQTISADDALAAYRAGSYGFGNVPGGQTGAQTVGGAGQLQPEQVALQQMAQTDPQTEALRQQLAGSYATSLNQAQTPTAQQFQSYLDIAKQVDPTTAAARQQLGSDLATQEALGSQLDPATQRQIEQQTRIAQAARGNVYGTPQLVEEAMTTGQAGLALQQQRQQALQSYLSAGVDPGTTALNLYNNQQNQLRANQGAALSYLGSGSTPYQAGSQYVQLANQNAATAAQGGPSYNTGTYGSSGTGGTGTSGTSSYQQAGTDLSQLATNWYNSMNQANLQAYGLSGPSTGQKLQSAGVGAATGAASGALTGAAAGGVGAPVGAIIGGLAGAAKGYFS